jgi:hypothetical protein
MGGACTAEKDAKDKTPGKSKAVVGKDVGKDASPGKPSGIPKIGRRG